MLIVAWWHLYLAALATHPLPVKASGAGYGAWRTGRQRAGRRTGVSTRADCLGCADCPSGTAHVFADHVLGCNVRCGLNHELELPPPLPAGADLCGPGGHIRRHSPAAAGGQKAGLAAVHAHGDVWAAVVRWVPRTPLNIMTAAIGWAAAQQPAQPSRGIPSHPHWPASLRARPPTRLPLPAGPSNHFWQGLLVSLFPPAAAAAAAAAPGAWRFLGGALRLLQRVGLDQLLYAPLNNCLMILYVSLVADQRSWPAARAKLVAELPAVQRRGWRVWPAVQLINQSLVPLEVRLGCVLCLPAVLLLLCDCSDYSSDPHSAQVHPPPYLPASPRLPGLQLRVLCNNLVAVCWTVYVIARARSVRSSRKLPVFNLAALSPRFRPAGGGGGGHVRQE